ncbi:MAG: exodeoxyribonuclease subunit alpha [Myxococcaceae bacterium]|nr:exodeoxyribonuclease subunit alpha [Myxococcaceae bacterium]
MKTETGSQLEELETTGGFSAIDVELARALCRLAQERSPELALAVAVASREVQAGHVCADLKRLAGQPLGDDASVSSARFPELAPWLEQLRRSPLVSCDGLGDPARPLVLDHRERLYLARYYDHEQQLAAQLLSLAASSPSTPPAVDPALVQRLFPGDPEAPDRQRDAALAARGRRLSIIVGGPGTGKTSTVVKLLALLVSDALVAGRVPPRTLLVAPTGKAAQRLTESIEKARARLPVDEAVKLAIATSASTLHRALGPLDGSLTRFRHDATRPLECDLVVLDEASMVDLALMRRFFAAVPAHARVILLGDPDQLASVEAGGVLYDLCRAAEAPSSALAGSLSALTESYRYPPESGIAALARAVHRQSVDDALAVLRAGLPDVTLHPALKPRELGRPLEREAKEHYKGLREHDLARRLATLDHFRVLCAHRAGPASVEQLNPLLSRALGMQRSASYPGRPIIVTQNDYATALFNGDVGVLHDFPISARKRDLMACFRGETATRHISLARLPSHESAYAMTVHKSQGSEFDRVAIVLPERPSRILSRELLYTAITRAKHGVTLYANEAALRASIVQRVTRSSGLVDRLLTRGP